MNVRTTLVAGLLCSGCGAAPPPTTAEPVTVNNLTSPEEAQDGEAVACADFTPEAMGPMTLDAPENVASPPGHVFRTESGIATCVLVPSASGERPTSAQDRVTVHYTGWTTDGEMFDSSIERDSPSTFPLSRVIAGWTEGVQLMRVGERRRLWIPEALAYGGRAGRPAGVLVFDIELREIVHMPQAPSGPADVAAPPSNASVTASGLYSRVLAAGQGTAHPVETSSVTVHYTGWTIDGAMFDSSITRGRPATFPLNRVIPGWTEGMQLMVEGETRRFWIPSNLAYDGRPGAPQGMLVFDVELISFTP